MMKKQLLVSVFLFCFAGIALTAEVNRVIAVTILKAQIGTRMVWVKTLDGKEQTFRFSSQAPVSSLAEAAINKSLHGGAGYQFLLHYTIKYGEKTATGFDYVGREEWAELSGILGKVDQDTRTIVVRSEDGKIHSFVAGEYCVVQSASEVRKFIAWSAGPVEGSPVVVRYMVVKDQNVAHLLEISDVEGRSIPQK